MTLPILRLSGTPYAQGLEHGRQLRDRIEHNLRIYFARFEREARLSRDEVLDRASRYLSAIERQNPDYVANLRGVADGSGFDLIALVALNVRYEILYYQFGVIAMEEAGLTGEGLADGCTAFAVAPEASANGHLLMGQNWDWIPDVRGAVLHTVERDGLEVLSFTEAGIVGGKIGLNSAGLGLAINGITTTDDDWSRLHKPFHVRCYEILRSQHFEDAVKIITDAERACSTNFLIAQAPNRIVDIEAAPDKLRLLECEGGCLVHTNHFVDPEGLGVVEPPSERRPYSRNRLARLSATLNAARPVTIEAIKQGLRDHEEHPNSICRHRDLELPPEEHYVTITSVIMDLESRTLELTDGSPCEQEYQAFRV